MSNEKKKFSNYNGLINEAFDIQKAFNSLNEDSSLEDLRAILNDLDERLYQLERHKAAFWM